MSRPVVGWKSAAALLGVSRATLSRQRERAGCPPMRAWWADAEECRAWYRGLLQELAVAYAE